MTKKPLHIEWTDQLLMAPWRYMNMRGRHVHASPLMNYINLPETRALIVSTVAACALNTGVKETAFILGGAAYSLAMKKFAEMRFPSVAMNGAYLDTAPEGKHKMPPGERKKFDDLARVTKTRFVMSLMNGVFPAAMATVAGAEPLTAACIGVMRTLHVGMEPLALRYRINRVAQGHWDLIPGRMKPEPETAHASASAAAPVPKPL